MARIEAKLRVGVPAEFAFQLWSNPEEYLNFMGAVAGARKTKTGYQLTTEVDSRKQKWNIEVTSEQPREVRWRNVGPGRFLGHVVLRTTVHGCEVALVVDYEPPETDESRRVMSMWDVGGDLLRFRLHAEAMAEEMLESEGVGAA